MFSIWTDFFRMGVKYFEEEIPKIENGNTILNILVSSIILVIFRYIYVMINLSTSNLLESDVWNKLSDIARIYIAYPLLPLIINPFVFFAGSSIYCFSARVLGGKGDYKTQYYLYSIIIVPYALIRSLIYLFYNIPYLETVIDIFSFLLAIYFFTVYIQATMANHKISAMKSLFSLTFIPLLLILLVGIFVLVIVLKTTEVIQGSTLLIQLTCAKLI